MTKFRIPFHPEQTIDQRRRSVKAEKAILIAQGKAITGIQLLKTGCPSTDFPSSDKDVELAEMAVILHD